jgi:hypothetical protein
MNETQAVRLAKMVQKHGTHKSYELALPLVEVSSDKLKKLSVGDVFLLGLDSLELILIDGETIYGEVALKKLRSKYYLELIALTETPVSSTKRKKFVNLRFSCGEVKIQTLKVGHTIEMTQVDLAHINLVLENKNIALGSLISVDNEIAVKIDEVK